MKGNETIRAASRGQQAQLEALQMRASLMWEEYRADLLAHPEAIEVPVRQLERGHVLFASEDGELTGFAALEPRADGDAELDGLFVEPARWGQGIGRRLLEAIRMLAAGMGCRTLHVVANPRALGFYERCGFREVGMATTDFGPAVRMARALP